jgi:predicted Zn-dependent protease with MMP-like domain
MLRRIMTEILPDADTIEKLAERAFATIPEDLRKEVDGVAIRVVDLPDERTCADMEIESPYDLLGLYHGIPLDAQSVLNIKQDVDMIFLYRLPLLAYAEDTGEDLYDVVKNVLIHEIGHHFGFSDDDMESIEESG